SEPSISGALPVSTLKTATIAMTHATKMTPTGTQWPPLPSRRPTSAVNRKPAIGRTSSSGRSASTFIALLTHRVVLVDQRCLLVAVDGDDDGKPDGRLSRRDGHDHQREDGSLR